MRRAWGWATAPLVFAFCDKNFESFGFVGMGEFAGTGFQVGTGRSDAAVVSAVDVNSPAAKAGLKVGDEIVAVEGAPLAVSPSANARMLLFGKAGQVHQVVVRRGGKEQAVTLTLAHK